MSEPSKKQRLVATKKHRPVTTDGQRIFISYARSDEGPAKELADELRLAKFEPFLDIEDIATGKNWPLEIGKALESSFAIVFLLSKDFLRSQTATKEWEFALTSAKHEGRVLPVLMAGTPERSVPWIAEHLKHVKASENWHTTTRRVVSALRSLPGAA